MNSQMHSPPIMKTFEDLLEMVGTYGKINYLFFICSAIGGVIVGMHSFAYQFLGTTPDYWCRVDELVGANWTESQIKSIAIPNTIKDDDQSYYNCDMYDLDYDSLARMDWRDATDAASQMISQNNATVQCYNRDYGGSVDSIVTKWDLVCERRALYSSTQAATQGGMLIGFVLIGWLMDKYGRLYIYKRSILLYTILGFVTMVSPTIEVFILMRVLTAMSGTGLYLSGFVLCIELCSPKQRSSIGCYYVIPWAFGMMLIAVAAYFVHNWLDIQAVLITPAILIVPIFWILPESPRWLILNGHYEEAFEVLQRIARSNGRTMPHKFSVVDVMKQIQIDMRTEDGIDDDMEKSFWKKVRNILNKSVVLLTDKTLRSKTICIFLSFFGVGLVYYGISVGAPAITENNHLYLFIAGALEVPSYLMLWPCVTFFGRRRSLIVFFLSAATVILAIMIIQLQPNQDDFLTLKLVLALLGKFAITPAYHLLWVFAAELFPTKYRSLAVGEANSVSRIGSICSPYVNDLLGRVVGWGPSALFSIFALIGGLSVLSLPETTNAILPDNVTTKQQQQRKATTS